MFGFYFSAAIPRSFAEVKLANQELFKQFFHLMLEDGVFFAPSMFEAGFICAKHTPEVIERTLTAANKAFTKLARQ